MTYGFGAALRPGLLRAGVSPCSAMPLLPAGIGALLVMLVARFAPARRVREVLGLVGALIGIGCSLIGQTSRFWAARFERERATAPQASLERLRQFAGDPLPSFIAGRGLAAAGDGHAGWWRLANWRLPAARPSASSPSASSRRTGSTPPAGCGCRAAASRRRSRARSAREAANAGWLGRAPAWAAIALKDWRVIPRDLRNFAQLLSPLVLLPVIYFNLLSGSGGAARDPAIAGRPDGREHARPERTS